MKKIAPEGHFEDRWISPPDAVAEALAGADQTASGDVEPCGNDHLRGSCEDQNTLVKGILAKAEAFQPVDGREIELKGPLKWTYYYLYVLLDVFSRYVVGWTAATRESATIAKQLIEESCGKHHIEPGQLTVHCSG